MRGPDAASGPSRASMVSRVNLFRIRFSDDGRRLALLRRGGGTCVWDTSTGRTLLDVPAAEGLDSTASLSPDGRFVAAFRPAPGGGPPRHGPGLRRHIRRTEIRAESSGIQEHRPGDVQPRRHETRRGGPGHRPSGDRLGYRRRPQVWGAWRTRVPPGPGRYSGRMAAQMLPFNRGGTRSGVGRPGGERLSEGRGQSDRTADRIAFWEVGTERQVRSLGKISPLMVQLAFSRDGHTLVASSVFGALRESGRSRLVGSYSRAEEGFHFERPADHFGRWPASRCTPGRDECDEPRRDPNLGHRKSAAAPDDPRASFDADFLGPAAPTLGGSPPWMASGNLKVWDLSSEMEAMTFAGGSSLADRGQGLSFDRDGRLAVPYGDPSGLSSRSIRIYDPARGLEFFTLSGRWSPTSKRSHSAHRADSWPCYLGNLIPQSPAR